MARMKSTVCSVCGAPRCERAKEQALCEAHLQEYWRNNKAKKAAKSGPKTKSTTCKLCGEPVFPNSAGMARCETHYREYMRGYQKSYEAKKRAEPKVPSPRVRVTVTGDRVSMDLATFQRLMKKQPATAVVPAKPTGQRLAVVSADLSRVLLVEATAGQVQEIDENEYAQQLMTLREAGYAVCVEG